MNQTIRVGTRESRLAVVQTELVLDRIRNRYPAFGFELVTIKTSGDLILDRSLEQLGGKGLFIKELETALLEGRIDLAVHSMKDLPAQLAEGLTIAAVSQREDPRDVLVSRHGLGLMDLPVGASVGTGSMRRKAQLLELRPDLQVKLLRGNVLTRIEKMGAGQYDAIVLAAAGLKRLGIAARATQYFSVTELIPAVGQGALAIQTRSGEAGDYGLDSVHCAETADCVSAERAFMIRLNGGCATPIGAYASIEGTALTLSGMWADPSAKRIWRGVVRGERIEAERLGETLAEQILEQAGGEVR